MKLDRLELECREAVAEIRREYLAARRRLGLAPRPADNRRRKALT